MTNTHPAHRRLLLAAGLGSLLIVLAACSTAASSSESASQAASQSASSSTAASKSAAESPAGPTVTITGFTSFGVGEITVPSGEQLTVVNDSSSTHTFTEGENGEKAADARVNEQIAAGSSATIDFPDPGDYHITCLFHAAMNMVVHVE